MAKNRFKQILRRASRVPNRFATTADAYRAPSRRAIPGSACRKSWMAHYLFDSIEEVQDYANRWLWTYDRRKSLRDSHERHNVVIGGITPKQKLALAA